MNVLVRVEVKFIFFFYYSFISSTLQECSDIVCSNVLDEVCGLARTSDGVSVIKKFHNACHLEKIKCSLQSVTDLHQVSDVICNIKKKIKYPYASGRRVHDFSIVGAYQACNHTCPTFCVDTYEPACAQIWKWNSTLSTLKPMINHCHIDLFSCATGLNVTMHPLSHCYSNSARLSFMTQVAALKSMGFIGEPPTHQKKN